ncbi:Ground-like domain containing protein [Brugia malayi]|uniref:BMA-GRL-17 n=1 Tax=Brugia malayi TaxID=6279 RepID=A0A0K0J881_BRUMA|nr:Ground-like domain containing protein [Brugia malayi]CRZ22062.1 BMA-GRL-17 [Brugia malayi]VIO97656.1 Ground-like domain containing protein [Brugia malayi]
MTLILIFVILLKISVPVQAFLLGTGNNCCCECGIPMPQSCGCATPAPLPICPPPIPCPPPICPICNQCPLPTPCPPQPIALCPPSYPVYLPQSSCNCGAGNTAAGTYTSPARGQNFGPTQKGIYDSVRNVAQSAGLAVAHGASPPSVNPQNLLGTETDIQNTSDIQQFPSIQNEAEKLNDPTFLNPDITHQLSPLSSTAASITERSAHGVVIISENKCNSLVLRELLKKNMDETDPVISKRSIHKAFQESIKENDLDIICSDAGFTYIVSTTEYCEAQKEKVICFVYKKT